MLLEASGQFSCSLCLLLCQGCPLLLCWYCYQRLVFCLLLFHAWDNCGVLGESKLRRKDPSPFCTNQRRWQFRCVLSHSANYSLRQEAWPPWTDMEVCGSSMWAFICKHGGNRSNSVCATILVPKKQKERRKEYGKALASSFLSLLGCGRASVTDRWSARYSCQCSTKLSRISCVH